MTFKNNWEKTEFLHPLPASIIESIVKVSYSDKKIISWQILAGGCSNLNIKIMGEGEEKPLIVRIYLRDKEAAYREKNLALFLKNKIPVPRVHTIGDYEGYRFAVTEFMKGITLRDLLLSDIPHDIGALLYDVGTILAKMAEHSFPKAGSFDRNLAVIESSSSEEGGYLRFVEECLHHQNVLRLFAPEILSKIHFYVEQYAFLLSDDKAHQLVHGDFDPSNILVDCQEGSWKISAILDWEFSFSGSVVLDVANMLRYAHEMPPIFESAFLEGLNRGGVLLPDQWRIMVLLLNLGALLDCLVRSDFEKCPHRCSDIKALVIHILKQLDSFSGNTVCDL